MEKVETEFQVWAMSGFRAGGWMGGRGALGLRALGLIESPECIITE